MSSEKPIPGKKTISLEMTIIMMKINMTLKMILVSLRNDMILFVLLKDEIIYKKKYSIQFKHYDLLNKNQYQ